MPARLPPVSCAIAADESASVAIGASMPIAMAAARDRSRRLELMTMTAPILFRQSSHAPTDTPAAATVGGTDAHRSISTDEDGGSLRSGHRAGD